ncbi:MAG: hypothetical protein GXP08_17495 [Gammaproteobacteria bacterium]|nr:hypothetical protein [Gammaproteobacteria bacterium]
MRIGYLSSRLIVIINILGGLLVILSASWIYVTHTDLTPIKTERVFQKNLKEANSIRKTEIFRQVHQSILINHKQNLNQHYENVQPIVWFTIVILLIFMINTFLFIQLLKSKVIRIR